MSTAVFSISFPCFCYRVCTHRGFPPKFEHFFYVLPHLTVLPALKKNDVRSNLSSSYSNVMFAAMWFLEVFTLATSPQKLGNLQSHGNGSHFAASCFLGAVHCLPFSFCCNISLFMASSSLASTFCQMFVVFFSS